jgi:hypothetical protein
LLGLALFIGGYRRPGLRWVADAGLTVAILIKISPLILLAYPIARRDRARCLRLLPLLCVGGGASVLVLGPRPWAQFLAIVPNLLDGFHNGANQAPGEVLAGIWPALRIGPLLSGLLLMAWLGATLRREAPYTFVLATGVLVMTRASSLVWYHHLTFLLVPALLVLTLSHEGNRWR